MKPQQLIGSILLIVCVGAAVYANAPRGQFVWDDALLVEKNAYIRDASHLPQIFTSDIGAGSDTPYRFYRPLQVLTYFLEYPLTKSNPAGYHIGSIFWHVLSALALFWLVFVLFKDPLLALLTGLFFVAHPVHTEAVTYISGRADPLSTAFVLLTLVFYAKAATTRRPLVVFAAVLSFAAALLSKENALVVLPLALLCTYVLRVRTHRMCLASLAALAVVYVVLRFTLLRHMLSYAVAPSTLLQRLPGFFEAWGAYLRILAAPFGLHMEYGLGESSFVHPRVVAGAAVMAFLLFLIIRRRERRGVVFFGASWFVIALLPVSNLYPINAFMAEHWLYLPSAGLFLVVGRLFAEGLRQERTQGWSLVGIVALVVFWGTLTFLQNETWKDPISFYQRLLPYAPFSGRLSNALGMAYSKEGRFEEGLLHLKKAGALSRDASKRDAANAYNNLAYAYDALGRHAQAAQAAAQALALDPGHVKAYNNLAVAYIRLGKYGEALEVCRRALEIRPRQADILNTQGAAYMGSGRYEEAVAAYRAVMEIDPDFARIQDNLDLALRSLREAQGAE